MMKEAMFNGRYYDFKFYVFNYVLFFNIFNVISTQKINDAALTS